MSTGVRILPRDTAGYMIDGVLGSYHQVRAVQEYYAKHQPEHRDEFASQARHINATHLRRLLQKAVREKGGLAATDHLDRYHFENMPRVLRTRFQFMREPTGISLRYRTGMLPSEPIDLCAD